MRLGALTQEADSNGILPSSVPLSSHDISQREIAKIVAVYGRKLRVRRDDPQLTRYLVKWVGSDDLTWETVEVFDKSEFHTEMRRAYDSLRRDHQQRYKKT